MIFCQDEVSDWLRRIDESCWTRTDLKRAMFGRLVPATNQNQYQYFVTKRAHRFETPNVFRKSCTFLVVMCLTASFMSSKETRISLDALAQRINTVGLNFLSSVTGRQCVNIPKLVPQFHPDHIRFGSIQMGKRCDTGVLNIKLYSNGSKSLSCFVSRMDSSTSRD